jgi:hypothetical protein
MNFSMNRIFTRTITFTPLLLVLLVVIVHAQTPCSGDCLTSPTGNVSLQGFIAAALMAMVKIAMPIITIFIVYSGFLFVTAQGNKAKLETAKTNFFYSVLGALLILSAWVLANLIGNTVTQLLGP